MNNTSNRDPFPSSTACRDRVPQARDAVASVSVRGSSGLVDEQDDLAVIIPVYNEEAIVEAVVKEWAGELGRLGIAYEIHAYNDGSRDGTLAALRRASAANERIVIHDKKNSGHGPTILLGFREHCCRKRWLFQVDSDNEISARHFESFWLKRHDYDFIVGIREGRESPLSRWLVSAASRFVCRWFYGARIQDVNCPYRLMRSSPFRSLFAALPENVFAPNVILTGMVGMRRLSTYEIPVKYESRKTGEVSVRKWRLLRAALTSFWQTVVFAMRQRCKA